MKNTSGPTDMSIRSRLYHSDFSQKVIVSTCTYICLSGDTAQCFIESSFAQLRRPLVPWHLMASTSRVSLSRSVVLRTMLPSLDSPMTLDVSVAAGQLSSK